MSSTDAKVRAAQQSTTAALEMLLANRGSVSAEMKDVIRAELARRGER